jgi:hypothetical protein
LSQFVVVDFFEVLPEGFVLLQLEGGSCWLSALNLDGECLNDGLHLADFLVFCEQFFVRRRCRRHSLLDLDVEEMLNNGADAFVFGELLGDKFLPVFHLR